MSRKKRKKRGQHNAPDAGSAKPDDRDESSPEGDQEVRAGGWQEDDSPLRWREFPVSGAGDEALRVNFSRDAYAELVAHAKDDLDAEVCGVLAGEFCEDDDGLHVSVQAAVRGSSTERGSSHVTYTQETWNKIHEEMDAEHPKCKIVGWYHSHPGFGVEFSDMDLFIQDNFFSGRGQVAFVTDPLGGEEAMCVRKEGELKHLSRFWVDGRRRTCYVPADETGAADAADTAEAGDSAGSGGKGGAASSKELSRTLKSVEDRLSQTRQALEDLRTSYYRFLTTVGMLIALGVAIWIGFMIYDRFAKPPRPPQMKAFLPGPVKVGAGWRWVSAQLMSAKLPPDIEAQLHEAERLMFLEAEKKRQAAAATQRAKSDGGPGGAAAPTSAPGR